MSRIELLPYTPNQADATGPRLATEVFERVDRGTEGEKFSGLQVTDLGLGFDTGFLLVTSEEVASERHSKWRLMQEQGLGEFLTARSVLVKVFAGQDKRFGILAEDLTAGGAVVYEFDDLDRPGKPPLQPALMVEASQWHAGFCAKLNEGPVQEIWGRIKNTENNDLRAALEWSYGFYIEELGEEKLPQMDFRLERDVQKLLGLLEENYWQPTVDSFFILTRKTADVSWPYERRIIVGDLGRGLDIVPDKAPLENWHRDRLYAMLSFIYSMARSGGSEPAML